MKGYVAVQLVLQSASPPFFDSGFDGGGGKGRRLANVQAWNKKKLEAKAAAEGGGAEGVGVVGSLSDEEGDDEEEEKEEKATAEGPVMPVLLPAYMGVALHFGLCVGRVRAFLVRGSLSCHRAAVVAMRAGGVLAVACCDCPVVLLSMWCWW